MKQHRIIALLLILGICLSCLVQPALGATDNYDEILTQAAQAEKKQTGAQTEQMLLDQEACPAGSSFCDWAAIAFHLAGVEEDYAAYLEALQNYVTKQYTNEELLQLSGPTDRQRIVLTVTVLGGDPCAFGKRPDGTAVNLLADATYDYAGDFTQESSNALAFALIALDSGAYETPQDSRYSRDDLKQLLLQMQNEDGGFGLHTGQSDPDITSMVLQALAPYQNEKNIETCTEQALVYLAGKMDDSGAFVSYDQTTSEGVSQLIIALCALGIDPDQDSRFCRNDSCPSQVLLQYRNEDGGFFHTKQDHQSDVMATEQAMLAFAALKQLQNGQGSIYDCTEKSAQPAPQNIAWLYVLIGVGMVVLVLLLLQKRKKGKKHE